MHEVTGTPPARNQLTPVSAPLARNIDALMERRESELAAAPLWEKAVARIAAFTGSMSFVVLHLVIFGLWIAINIGWCRAFPSGTHRS
jgi:uncharacterized membrane protein